MGHLAAMDVKVSFVARYEKITSMRVDSTRTVKLTRKNGINVDGAG